MIRFALCCLVYVDLMAFIALPAMAQTLLSAPSPESLAGSWIDSTYRATLESTHSPFAAYKSLTGDHIVLITLDHSPEDNEWGMGEIISFHEGTGNRIAEFLPTSEPNTWRLGLKLPPMSYVADTDQRITLLPGDSTIVYRYTKRQSGERYELTFQRLREPDQVVINRTVLAGAWEDSAGHRFVFEPTGEALWDGQPAQYAVIRDMVLAKVDYLRLQRGATGDGEREYYAFRRTGDTLVLSTLVWQYDEFAEKAGETLFTLRRAQKR